MTNTDMAYIRTTFSAYLKNAKQVQYYFFNFSTFWFSFA